jgi:hypothetical protein
MQENPFRNDKFVGSAEKLLLFQRHRILQVNANASSIQKTLYSSDQFYGSAPKRLA